MSLRDEIGEKLTDALQKLLDERGAAINITEEDCFRFLSENPSFVPRKGVDRNSRRHAAAVVVLAEVLEAENKPLN